ncbi:MAG: YrhB domain-containing protein [Candidatus Methylacidiphilales bacterium]|nr:YrhB domain-containing protein [Candidatus Methylacidiphilales bacterium]
MIKRYEAINLVEEEVNKHYDPRDLGALEVIDKLTLERPYGWIFFVNTESFIATNDKNYSAVGFGPIVYTFSDNSLHYLPSYLAPEVAIADFEKKNGLAGS